MNCICGKGETRKVDFCNNSKSFLFRGVCPVFYFSCTFWLSDCHRMFGYSQFPALDWPKTISIICLFDLLCTCLTQWCVHRTCSDKIILATVYRRTTVCFSVKFDNCLFISLLSHTHTHVCSSCLQFIIVGLCLMGHSAASLSCVYVRNNVIDGFQQLVIVIFLPKPGKACSYVETALLW
jgi:hypothetical protein